MPEPVIYIRGIRPPFVDAASVDAAMLADLKSVATLGDESVSALRDRLSAAEGFLDPKTLSATLCSVIEDESTALSVQRTMQNLSPSDVERLAEALTQRQEEEEDFLLDKNELDRLHKTLSALVRPYPAMARFEKAERLSRLTGQELESIQLICDLRPIFDEKRNQIEGMMPYTRLCIVATGADGLPNSFEAELTQQQVHDLAEKATKARAKLDVLRKNVESWLPGGLPDLPLTRVTRKESSDA